MTPEIDVIFALAPPTLAVAGPCHRDRGPAARGETA